MINSRIKSSLIWRQIFGIKNRVFYCTSMYFDEKINDFFSKEEFFKDPENVKSRSARPYFCELYLLCMLKLKVLLMGIVQYLGRCRQSSPDPVTTKMSLF